jgi:hypothetical protein
MKREVFFILEVGKRLLFNTQYCDKNNTVRYRMVYRICMLRTLFNIVT